MVVSDRTCPFYGPPSSVLWLCEDHKKVLEQWEADKNTSQAIERGIEITKEAWKPFDV